MKTKNIILIILVILAVVGGWLILKNFSHPVAQQNHQDTYYCPMHPHYTSDHPGNCPICGMTLVKKENPPQAVSQTSAPEKKILYWTDPMIPGYKTSGPGKSPMGMDLVPIYEQSNAQEKISSGQTAEGYSTVSIDTQKQQLIGIKTVTTTKKPLVKTIHAYGYVAHDLELYDAQLEYIDAWHLYYTFLSRRPIKDEFRTDWRDYYMKSPSENRWRSDEKVKAQQRLVKAEYELIHMGLTETDIEQLRQIKYGQPWVQPDLLFFEKNQPYWIYAQVLESDLGFIAPGQKIIATIPAYSETTEGIVRSISPVIDPATRTTRVRIELPSYKSELSVNMFVNVDMPVELNDSLLVPREAIMDTGLNKIVFVQTKNGVFEPRSIQTTFEGDGMVAVKSGLKEGETIVSSGNFLLDSESRLQSSLAGGQ